MSKQSTNTFAQLSPQAQDAAMENMFRQLISLLGENPDSPTFENTPRNLREAWRFWTSGYQSSTLDVLNPQPALNKDGDDIVVIKNIPFYSHCEKHLAPIIGTAHIAFIPKKLTTGFANVSKLVDIISRRIQTQGGITNQIADALEQDLKAAGAAVVTSCQHMCLASRGSRNLNLESVERAFRGSFKSDRKLRDEFLNALNV